MSQPLSLPWGMVVTLDVYIGLALFSAWIFYREEKSVVALLWTLVLVICVILSAAHTYYAQRTVPSVQLCVSLRSSSRLECTSPNPSALQSDAVAQFLNAHFVSVKIARDMRTAWQRFATVKGWHWTASLAPPFDLLMWLCETVRRYLLGNADRPEFERR